MDSPRIRWIIAEPRDEAARELANTLRTSRITGQLLLNRGYDSFEACRDFLTPLLKALLPPEAIANLKPAAARVAEAIRSKQTIVIYGDYDVDGITATAILWHAITRLGGAVETYIPHRVDEGYGLNVDAVRAICGDDANKLVITVDCGVTALEAAKAARECGVDLIITDHHEWRTGPAGECDLPNCHSVVHPRLPNGGEPYGNPHLCGAGVAFKLAWAIGLAISGATRVDPSFKEFLIDATALAALGTIADVVPLVGENRVLAAFGLGGLQQTKLTGIRALIRSAGLDGKDLDSYHVGFLLGPRLNACGRLGHAKLAVEMLTTADQLRAEEIADFLETQNRERQAVERTILEQAIAQVADPAEPAIVLGHAEWHPGVIGVVASRLVERFHRPTVLIALGDETGGGSGRSISGFHLADAFNACTEHLVSHGGHEMAAGLKLSREKFDAFRAAFIEHARQTLEEEQLTPRLRLDAVAQLAEMNEGLVRELKRLGPFGPGNRKPLLCFERVELAAAPKRVGKTGDHLSLYLRQGNTRLRAIAFGQGHWCDDLSVGSLIDLAAEPSINEFNGRISVELAVKDLRWSDEPSGRHIPSDEAVAR